MTDSLLRLLLLLPVVAGMPLLAWTGALDSAFGVLWGTTAVAGTVYLIGYWLLYPRRALAHRARQLAPDGPVGDDDWMQIDACLDALGSQRERDRGRIRELEARLHRAQAATDGADMAKRVFLANVGHEIRTPMNVVVGMTCLALKLATAPQQRDHLLRADRAAQELLNQLDNLLEVAKLETGELRLERTTFAPTDLFSQLIGAYAEQAHRKGLTLRHELDQRLPPMLVGAPNRLRQLLASLTDNAIKFTDSGEIVVACKLQARCGNAARLGFEVRDTGIGIAPDEQEVLFGAFRQGDASLTRRHGGTGVGLCLCSRLLQAMGSTLELDSRPDVGTSFRFELAFELPPTACGTRAAPGASRAIPAEPLGTGAGRAAAPQLDLRTTRLRLRGSTRLLRRLLTRFRLDHGDFVADYRSLHDAGDRFGAAQRARALESAASSLGALELCEAASRLALKRRADDDPAAELDCVQFLLNGLLAEIDQRLGGSIRPSRAPNRAAAAKVADSTPPHADTDVAERARRLDAIDAQLRALAGLLADFDAAAINAFESLREHLPGLVPHETIDALQNAINGFDFVTAGELLQGLAADLGMALPQAQ